MDGTVVVAPDPAAISDDAAADLINQGLAGLQQADVTDDGTLVEPRVSPLPESLTEAQPTPTPGPASAGDHSQTVADSIDERSAVIEEYLAKSDEPAVTAPDQSDANSEAEPETEPQAADEPEPALLETPDSPFEKLYNLNPEAFAQLPTAEFVAIVKQLQNLESEIEAKGQQYAALSDFIASKLPAALEARQAFSQDLIDALKRELAANIKADAEARQKLEADFTAVTADDYTMSKKDVNEAYAQLANDYLEQIEQSQKKAVQARQAMYDQYTPGHHQQHEQ